MQPYYLHFVSKFSKLKLIKLVYCIVNNFINPFNFEVMAKSGQTSKPMAKLASKVLTNPNSSSTAKKLAGSVLSQAPNRPKGKK